MFHRLILATAGLALLTACDDTMMSGGGGASAEAPATAVTPLIGKTLLSDNATVTFIFNDDGTVGGMFRGEAIVGNYSADATEVCSTYEAPEQLTGKEFCSTPAINGSRVVFNRRDGTTSSYTIQN
ncbi:hypothetical protein [Pacificoceanicola onchidii]|uniref:hypothetical protein n=1 Tax=Pacificoceanicola onchidii TaxID=2562685 RepID=UPI001455DE04|nr:hypothetical protein [Pacificoceanicola onchidii]